MYHDKKLEEVFEELQSSPNGLSSIEAKKRLNIYKENKINTKKVTIFDKILDILKNYFLWLFIFSFFLSLIIKQYVDGILIGFFIVLYILFDLLDDIKTEKIIESLEERLSTYVDVIRDNNIVKVNYRYLVPGDIVILYRGNKVPADIRIIESENLYVDESMITGESEPVRKYNTVLDKNTNIFNMVNILFAGSIIVDGYCKGIVIATGNNTYIGKLNKNIENKNKRSILEEDISKFGKYMSIFTFIIIIFLFILLYLFRYFNIYQAIIFSISLAILVVPEGLPSALIIILYYGIDRLKKKGILIKNPNILESLGYIDLIISDKTGTLTYNEYNVNYIYFNGKVYNSYEIDNSLDPLLEVLYNNLYNNDITDRSLSKFLASINYKRKDQIIKFIPFDEKRKVSISFVNKNGKVIEYIKGVPEYIVNISNYIYINDEIVSIEKYKEKILDIIDKYSSEGYKIIGVGYKDNLNIVFLGLVIMSNKLRENIYDYVRFLKENNIDLIIVSGDHLKNVEYIGKKLRISDKALLGDEIKKMSDKELYENLLKYKLVARADPEDKLRIIEVFKKYNKKLAMVGDGINDILALKKADVGITFRDAFDATKEVADIILMDSSLENIVEAIKEGKKELYLVRIYIIVVLSILIGILLNILISFFVYRVIFLGAITLLILNLVIETINSIVVVNGDIEKEDIVYKKSWTTILDKKFILGIVRNGLFIGLDSLILSFATFGSVFTIMLFFIISTYILFIYYGKKYGISYEKNISLYISFMFSIAILIIFTYMPYSKAIGLKFPPLINYFILLLVLILFMATKYLLYIIEKNHIY